MIDWQSLTLQLRKHYGPLGKAAMKLGKHPQWLNELARGEIREPKFSDGLKLLDFASDHLPTDVLRGCRQ